jgi:anti-anti-sigma regulatory factor
MNAKEHGTITWSFPANITFDLVSEYSLAFSDISMNKKIVFDMSRTTSIHSSFIGFLIHTEHTMRSRKGTLYIELSYTAERLLTLLNIINYFKNVELVKQHQLSA